MIACPNLRSLYGKTYKMSFDPSYDHSHVPRAKLDPWGMQVRCMGDIVIYPYGVDTLAVEIDGHRYTAAKLGRMPGVTLYHDGDTEKTFLFPLSLFDEVAKIVKPRKRNPPPSAERIEAARQRLSELRRGDKGATFSEKSGESPS